MFTLNRLSLIGLGAGLALVGCASPMDDTVEPIDETSAAAEEETNQEEGAKQQEEAAKQEEAPATLSAEEMAALEAVDPGAGPSQPLATETDEGATESRSDKIGIYGWGGFSPYGAGFYRTGVWGTGVPFYGAGFYGGLPYGGFYPGYAGVVPRVGWGAWGGCGAFGCGRLWW